MLTGHHICFANMAQTTTQTGLEPVTSAVTGRRSNQLSHWANQMIVIAKSFINIHQIRQHFKYLSLPITAKAKQQQHQIRFQSRTVTALCRP